ncbi:MAG: hypothetical protein AAB268_00960 [Elusimicrobiota bacterium]
MSLQAFHRFFIVLCLALFAFTGYWASGGNPTAVVTPWLMYVSVAGACAVLCYLFWHIRSARLPK